MTGEGLSAPGDSSSTGFLRPEFKGERFDHGSIPLSVLEELPALGELVVDVAKWIYLENHPHLRRPPKGVFDRVAFRLTGIGKASSVAYMDMTLTSPRRSAPQVTPMLPPEDEVGQIEYFREAWRMIVNDVGTASEEDAQGNIRIPPNALNKFNKIGKSLLDDETMKLSWGVESSNLTKESRLVLIRAANVRQREEEVSVRALVPEIDQDRRSFTLNRIEGGRVPARLDDTHLDTVMQMFNSYRESEGNRILVTGLGIYNRQGRLARIEPVTEVVPLHPLDVPSQLYDLRRLKRGWFDGEGKSLSTRGLAWLSDSFERLYPNDLPPPYIYPTPEGEVEAEWSISPYEVSLTVDLRKHQGLWCVLNMSDDYGEIERRYDLTEDGSWQSIEHELRFLLKLRV